MILATGILLLGAGVWTLHMRNREDAVPLVELLIDRALGEDPPPRNAWDRRIALINGSMMMLAGLAASVIGAGALYTFAVRAGV